jgi:septal ring factor EnvC (AmiA/AmiB activator)
MTAGRRPPKARARKRALDPSMVLVEDLRAQMKIVVEAVVALDDRMERGFATVRAEASEARDVLESSIRTLSRHVNGIDTRLGGIDTRLDGIDTRLGGIDDQLKSIRQEAREQAALWARKADAAALAALDQRVTALERSARI